jgi:hypothetical protein
VLELADEDCDAVGAAFCAHTAADVSASNPANETAATAAAPLEH